MMEITPRTRSSARYRRAPTPKLSERKKKLFDDRESNHGTPSLGDKIPFVRLERIIFEENEDSDLGPMSPLQFSSSPSTFNKLNDITENEQRSTSKNRRTDFTNIMDELSMERNYSMKKLSINLSKKLDGIGNDANDDDNRKDGSEEDVVGPLCTSMKKLNSTADVSSDATTLHNESIEQEENYAQQMKTPSEMSTISTKDGGNHLLRGISFKKSLIFDTGLTPHDDESSTPNTKSAESDSNERPKAKTSLTFSDPTISVRSFYGKSNEQIAPAKSIPEPMKISSHAFAAAIAKRTFAAKKKSKSQSLAKRMKANAPSLWRFSGKNKFNRSKRHSNKPKTSNNNKNSQNTSTGSVQIVEVEVENDSKTAQFTSNIEQNLRLQKILKDQTNVFNASHEINWNGTPKLNQSSTSTTVRQSFLDSDDEDDENDDPLVSQPSELTELPTEQNEAVESVEPSNRKFFKSSASSAAKKYRIMGRLSATVKRGGDLIFEPVPKRRKRKPNEVTEKIILNTEISSIIDRLDSPRKNKVEEEILIPVHQPIEIVTNDSVVLTVANHTDFIEEMQINVETMPQEMVTTSVPVAAAMPDVNKYRQMIPYNTTDPEKISQQETILDLLITNDICDDETFKIFIAEPDAHKDQASKILDSLYCVNTMIPDTYENEMAPEWMDTIQSAPILIDPTTTIETPEHVEGTASELESIVTTDVSTNQATETEKSTNETSLFPIFNKNFNANAQKTIPTEFTSLSKPSKDWHPIGNQQYQIDAGQKAFGLRQCPQCDMQYSVHEPEDELLHLKYHNSVNILSFKGWNNERLVTEIPDWGLNGRIIYVCETDSKAKKERIKEILGLVDHDLGFATRNELKPKTLVYLAIAKQQIVGVCVAQPLERAHRLKTENGVDFSSSEFYPAKCGISRIWVATPYRRHGIASKLLTSMRGHFRFGCFLTFDEIAFSSPTDDGKRFAASLAQRSDFLIYEN